MSIELATTQPVRQPGTPGPPGGPSPDQLGLTLRERMWLARAALATMVLSAVSSVVLLSMLQAEPPRPTGAMQTELAERSLRPMPVALPPLELEPLPAAEVQRALPARSEPPPPALTTEAPPAAAEPPVPETRRATSAPSRKVVITRGRVLAIDLPAAPAVDLSRPQSLAPRRVEKPERAAEIEARPVPAMAKPVPEPELKRPSFE